MTKYCSNCGERLSDDADFCHNCGASQKYKGISNGKIMIIALVVIIIALVIFLVMGMKTSSELIITSSSTITTADDFNMKLSAQGEAIENQPVHVVFNNAGQSFEYDVTTDSKGKASVSPHLDVGEYEVACRYDENVKYSESSDRATITIEEKEPNYESFDYPRTFASTDTDGDGYVLLSDMTIAHTPKDVQYQMYDDSDDNNDGKLNEHEYYKFMYKLNYDKQSYGL